jgi:hypothetical protein
LLTATSTPELDVTKVAAEALRRNPPRASNGNFKPLGRCVRLSH